MKFKTYIFIFFILLSELGFGQVIFTGTVSDSSFIKFKRKVYLLERLLLNIEPIEPNNTISLTATEGIAEEYKLKYVERIGNPPSFEEGLKTGNIVFINSSYSCTKFGTDFIIIHMARPTGMINDIKYYYEIVRKEE